MEDLRLTQLKKWLNSTQITPKKISPLAGDASFRRYFRIHDDSKSYIAMDAPPTHEKSCGPFLQIAQDLHSIGWNTPKIYAHNIQQGFLLLSDFGDISLNQTVNAENIDYWYQRCIDNLIPVLKHKRLPTYKLTNYNDGLYSYYEESSWFITWFLQQYCQHKLTHIELSELEREIHLITQIPLEQPQVITHRDYHSRNIMITEDNELGIIDFQDAVVGPITYDLVSLIRGCYLDWPQEQVQTWISYYYTLLVEHNLITNCSLEKFTRWVDWTGLQRHLKCTGLFVRLNLRDNKPGYLQYIPRLLTYLSQETANYPELRLIHELAETYRQKNEILITMSS